MRVLREAEEGRVVVRQRDITSCVALVLALDGSRPSGMVRETEAQEAIKRVGAAGAEEPAVVELGVEEG